ncbi:hypothetical protein SteCoe_32602 [Stentor coeruleus]|uniref:F-box domain-containing protein n=1 Tax=Stentor coeruleus TaxID=5963 RepID=A0A1R2AYL6_9CILI|nr:hypothetical protein SteCoe_32602 [Stentor coeruleus]
MLMNWITVQDSGFTNMPCKVCLTHISNKTIGVGLGVYPKHFTHLECFKPQVKKYIRNCDIYTSLKYDSSKSIFNEWLENWNSNFIPLDKPIEYNKNAKNLYCIKTIKTQPPKKRRVFIEIFKYFDIYDLLKNLSQVCKGFYHTAWESELWWFLITRDFKIIPNINENLRHYYLKLFTSACLECQKILKSNDFSRCPLIKRVLCFKCKTFPKYSFITKQEIKDFYGFDPKILKIHFELSCIRHSQIVYLSTFLNELYKFREKNKRDLLEKLYVGHNEHCEIVKFVEGIDIGKMDKGIVRKYGFKIIEISWSERLENKDYFKVFKYVRTGKSKISFKRLFRYCNHRAVVH